MIMQHNHAFSYKEIHGPVEPLREEDNLATGVWSDGRSTLLSGLFW
jgi:hypothetical protein